jgi:hypothetical protein
MGVAAADGDASVAVGEAAAGKAGAGAQPGASAVISAAVTAQDIINLTYFLII